MSYHKSTQARNADEDNDLEKTIADAIEHFSQSNIRIRSHNRTLRGEHLKKYSESKLEEC